MNASTRDNMKIRKRPPETGTLIGVRLQPDMLDWLDAERAKQEDQPSRPEMIRQFLKRIKNDRVGY